MGTRFHLILHTRDGNEAERAADAVRTEIERLDAQLSDWERDSELSRLSRRSDGEAPTGWIEVGADLAIVLRAGLAVAHETEGAFDPTIGPFVRLWRRSKRQGELPTAARVAEARAAVGHHWLEVDAECDMVRLLVPRMRLDLGGIAKGYAADRAIELLRSYGIEHALVDAGGDLRATAPPPGKDAWHIGLERLETPGPSDLVIELAVGALATSGSTYQHVTLDDTRYSHIVDPSTGLGCTELRQVNVWAQTGTRADAWASALSVLPIDRGLALVEATAGLEARFSRMNDAGEVVVRQSRGFPASQAPPVESPRPDR